MSITNQEILEKFLSECLDAVITRQRNEEIRRGNGKVYISKITSDSKRTAKQINDSEKELKQ